MKELLDSEKQWLEYKNLLDLEINHDWVRKTIFYHLYSDQKLKYDSQELKTYIAKTFNSQNFQKYFSVLGIDEEAEVATFIIFFNSLEDNSELSNLQNKLSKLVDLVNSLKDRSYNENLLSWVSENNYGLQALFDQIRRDDYEIKVVIFNENLKEQKFDETILETVISNINLKPEILTKKQYTVALAEEYSDYKVEQKSRKPIILKYYDSNKGQTSDDEERNSNFIEYQGENGKNYIFSISAYSLYGAYDTYKNQLFDKNVRYYIKGSSGVNKTVNDGIFDTLKNNPQKFWILNNGLTIIGSIDHIDQKNKEIHFKDLDIVNGAQTVTNIYMHGNTHKKAALNSLKDIYIPTKVIGVDSENIYNEIKLINDIVRSANSQKPISERDLVSNNPEMKKLQSTFKNEGIILSIKRGAEDHEKEIEKEIKDSLIISNPKKTSNDTVGQYVKSTILQDPAKAIQQKNKLFQKENYGDIFNNQEISSINILQVYKFYTFFDEILKELIKEEQLNFELIDFNHSSEITLTSQIRENLFIQFFPWIIAFYWYARWFNRDVRTKNEIVIPNPKDVINDLKDNRKNAYIIPDDLFYIPENVVFETRLAIINISNFMVDKIYEMFTKANEKRANEKRAKYGVASFSYNNVDEFNYGQFLVELLRERQKIDDNLREILSRLIIK